VLSGAQAVHTMSWDEALGLPSEEAALLALRTQQIIAHESGVARSIDPLGGSYLIESLTDELERRAVDLLEEIDTEGGMLVGVGNGRIEQAIADAAWAREQAIATGEIAVIGVNRFAPENAPRQEPEVFDVPEGVRRRQVARLVEIRTRRDQETVARTLADLQAAAATEANLMPSIVASVMAYASVGEISAALESVFGRHVPSTVI
jgi:methylmalonyl-CoA mutase N-terminal domain/subunit